MHNWDNFHGSDLPHLQEEDSKGDGSTDDSSSKSGS